MIELVHNRYGKSRVRLMKVVRHADHHDLYDWNVQLLLTGDFDAVHTEGDNSRLLATDTMKNTVYSRARVSTATTPEHFAMELAGFVLGRNAHVATAEVTIESGMWKRMTVDGSAHPHAFLHGSNETQTTVVTRAQGGEFAVTSGLNHLLILKTTDSSFAGFLRDELTTLKEVDDRLLGTAVEAHWTYRSPSVESDFTALRTTIREILLKVFAGHKSLSVQQTLYAMGEAVLNAVPEVAEIHLVLPNKHCLLVDLSRFGQDNPNQIFVPTDEPHGTLEATLRRKS
jgi:urate oxidase